MREFIFRGKRVDNGEWVYGGYVKDEHNNAHMIFTNELGAYNAGFKPKREDYVINYYEVDPETIGQYTGLKDRNNMGIYEGDILLIVTGHKPGSYIVIWDEMRVAWWGKNVKCDTRENIYEDDFFQLLNDGFQDNRRQLIGNIHDNNNLLEADK